MQYNFFGVHKPLFGAVSQIPLAQIVVWKETKNNHQDRTKLVEFLI